MQANLAAGKAKRTEDLSCQMYVGLHGPLAQCRDASSMQFLTGTSCPFRKRFHGDQLYLECSCHLQSGALGDGTHMLLECPALADLRDEFLRWLQSAQVSWLGLCGPETSPWSAATSLPALIECHADDEQALFHPFSLVGCQG